MQTMRTWEEPLYIVPMDRQLKAFFRDHRTVKPVKANVPRGHRGLPTPVARLYAKWLYDHRYIPADFYQKQLQTYAQNLVAVQPHTTVLISQWRPKIRSEILDHNRCGDGDDSYPNDPAERFLVSALSDPMALAFDAEDEERSGRTFYFSRDDGQRLIGFDMPVAQEYLRWLNTQGYLSDEALPACLERFMPTSMELALIQAREEQHTRWMAEHFPHAGGKGQSHE
jgi:hypothetical protein